MIEQTPALVPGAAVSVVLLPNRSLSRRGLVGFLVAQGVFAGGFAALAAWRGNVFAPGFALAELAIVAYCLWRVWHLLEAGEVISLTPERLEIARMSGVATPVQFRPYWVRLVLQPGHWRGWPSRLLVCSHGREVEIGAFLNDGERRDLAQKLSALLAQATGPAAREQKFDAG